MRSEFMIERQGKNFCLYAGLLDEAHQQGLKELRTTLLQIPGPDNGNVAICQSLVVTEKGVFTGLGDASPQNVARPMLTCLIRMAETRAKARALRDAVNVGVVALEELDAEEGNAEPAAFSNAGRTGYGSGGGGSDPGRYAGGAGSSGAFRPAVSPEPVDRGLGTGRREGSVRAAAPISREAPRRPAGPVREERTWRAEVSERSAPHRTPSEPDGAETGAPGGGGPTSKSDAMTPAQRGMLLALAQQVGEAIELEGLTRQAASQRITELKGRAAAAPRAA